MHLRAWSTDHRRQLNGIGIGVNELEGGGDNMDTAPIIDGG